MDVIDWFDHRYKPNGRYEYFLDLDSNLQRIGPLLNKDCIKIFHATTSHWLFNNAAEYERLLALQKRRGAALKPRRTKAPARSIEDADAATLIGNDVTEATYSFAKKKMHQIPISTTHIYPFPHSKDIEAAKKNFIWLGGVGAVHKGLDLVLEAFSRLPEYQLFVCGNVQAEKDFESLYQNELYHTGNIRVLGAVDMGGDAFRTMAGNAIALIYPSCAEGQSGGVVTCMHAGLIPAVSPHVGVDVGDFGFTMQDATVECVIRTVGEIAATPSAELRKRSKAAWEYARSHHTRERFSEEFTAFVAMLEADRSRRN